MVEEKRPTVAELYPAGWGWQLHPLYGPEAKCNAPGKQPKVADWVNLPEKMYGLCRGSLAEMLASVLEDILGAGDNLGLVVPKGCVVFDCDEPEKAEGLLAVYPDAPAQMTRTGGVHLVFRLKPGEEISNAQSVILNGARGDIRTHVGQIVVEPSVGVGGGAYRWFRRLPKTLEELPLRPEELARARQHGGGSRQQVEKQDHGRRPEVATKTPSRAALRQLEPYDGSRLVNLILLDSPIGAAGNRDNATMSAVGAILHYYETSDPKVPYRLLSRCIEADNRPSAKDGNVPSLDMLWSKCCRLADRALAEAEERRSFVQRMAEVREERQAKLASEQDTDKAALTRRLVLYMQKGTEYYIFEEETGGYYGPIGGPGLVERLERCCPSLVEKTKLRKKSGETKKAADILAAYGAPLGAIEMRVGEKGIRYDQRGNKLIMGVWQLRDDIQPKYSEEIAAWLLLLGGDQPEKLLDWLACVAENRYPACAIYLRGPKESGKSLLAAGVARLWGQPATPYHHAIARFNTLLTRSPLVVLDEGLEDAQSSARFREFVAASELTIEPKHQTPITLVGSPRVLITSNNDDALRIREEVSADDMDAIIDRIGWIEVSHKAQPFLANLGGRYGGTADWVDGDKIAEHVLWLRANRKVTPGKRFLVAGWDHPKLRALPGRTRGAGEVLVGIAHYIHDLQTRRPGAQVGSGGLLVGGGEVLVNVPALNEYWVSQGERMPPKPTEAQMARALKLVSRGQKTVQHDGVKKRMWDVDTAQVLQKAEEIGIGTTDELRAIIDKE